MISLADNYLLSFEVILHAKKNNLQIRDSYDIDYKLDTHLTSCSEKLAFTYQLETFNLIYKYFRKNYNEAKILLVGANGYIGSQLYKKLKYKFDIIYR